MASSKNENELVQDPSSRVVHRMSKANAHDMKKHMGWIEINGIVPEDVCEACLGTGVFPEGSKDTCWHCGGEGLNPK